MVVEKSIRALEKAADARLAQEQAKRAALARPVYDEITHIITGLQTLPEFTRVAPKDFFAISPAVPKSDFNTVRFYGSNNSVYDVRWRAVTTPDEADTKRTKMRLEIDQYDPKDLVNPHPDKVFIPTKQSAMKFTAQYREKPSSEIEYIDGGALVEEDFTRNSQLFHEPRQTFTGTEALEKSQLRFSRLFMMLAA